MENSVLVIGKAKFGGQPIYHAALLHELRHLLE
jgi:hypothetical protein